MSRFTRSYRLAVAVAALGLLLAACGDDDAEPDATPGDQSATEAEEEDGDGDGEEAAAPDGEPQFGGKLVVAYPADLVTLDSMSITQAPHTPRHAVFEQLVANDAALVPQPALAETWEVSDDGLTWTFYLREGVNFHNGEVLDADDVVASWERFEQMGARAFELEMVEEVVAVDDLTVELRLSATYGALPESMAAHSGGWSIMPASVIEQIGTDVPNDPELLIGTGPYMAHEIIPEVSTTIVRFDDYTRHDGPNDLAEPSSLAGPRFAYFDEIEVISIPDPATRTAALLAGDVDLVQDIPGDEAARVEADPDADLVVLRPGDRVYWKFNPTIPPFDDPILREAVRVGMNPEEIMAGYGPEEFWRINATPRYQEGQGLWTDMSYLFENDMEKARQLVEESDYDGETVKLLASPGRLDFTQVIPMEQQLADMGFNVEIDSVDTATFGTVRQDLTAWNIKPSGGPSLVGGAYLASSGVSRTGEPWPGLPDEWDEALSEVTNLAELDARAEAAREFYELHAEINYEIWLGEVFIISGFRSDLRNVPEDPFMALWDIWREQ